MDTPFALLMSALVTAAVVGGITYLLVGRAARSAIDGALQTLDERATTQREEAVKLASDTLKVQGAEVFGARAQVLDGTLRDLRTEVQTLRDRNSEKFGQMDEAISKLALSAEGLRVVLSNPAKRGAWGERQVQDIFQAVGFVEGVNFEKQKQVEGEGKGRPDYHINMPPDRILFLDSKFPLDKYADYVEAGDGPAADAAKAAFIDAMKGHVNTLAKRDYVDKDSRATLDYVLMFIPNESLNQFVNEQDPRFMEDALKKKVVVCTPLTLYTFLVVVRQATESFHTEKSAEDIMKRVNLFAKEWANYTKQVEAVEKAVDGLRDTLASLNVGGKRYKKLNVQVREIEKLRKRAGVSELEVGVEPYIEGEADELPELDWTGADDAEDSDDPS